MIYTIINFSQTTKMNIIFNFPNQFIDNLLQICHLSIDMTSFGKLEIMNGIVYLNIPTTTQKSTNEDYVSNHKFTTIIYVVTKILVNKKGISSKKKIK